MPSIVTEQKKLTAAQRASLLLRNRGLREVNAWTLPNDDLPSDDVKLAREFKQNIDGLMEVTDIALQRLKNRL